MKNLEVWADSFHEGEWFLKHLLPHFKVFSHQYLHGFIPEYKIELNESLTLNVTVFGSYKSWENLPTKIAELLEFGKPDIILYDRDLDKIILAVEETAAVPTGNQALQRCERIFGSSYLKVPFVYLFPEYGTHSDGHNRRTSIWPTLLMLKLSLQFQTPSIALLYSDIDNPEDYTKGTGLLVLFQYSYYLLLKHLGILSKKDYEMLNLLLTNEIGNMINFIKSQWENLLIFFPGIDSFDKEFTANLALKILNDQLDRRELINFLEWPKTSALPRNIKKVTLGFYNKEAFLLKIDESVKKEEGYVISKGEGSKPQTAEDIKGWLSAQTKVSKRQNLIYESPVKEFLKTKNGNYHVSTSRNITYFLDSIETLEKAYSSTFVTRKISLVKLLDKYKHLPVFLYICNSLTPGRMFSDPFTGQFSAFANIFCYDSCYKKNRSAVVYLPYQSAALFFDGQGKFVFNKGTYIYSKLADLIICNNGYVISLIDRGKIHGL